jgi:hypothetical protein
VDEAALRRSIGDCKDLEMQRCRTKIFDTYLPFERRWDVDLLGLIPKSILPDPFHLNNSGTTSFHHETGRLEPGFELRDRT